AIVVPPAFMARVANPGRSFGRGPRVGELVSWLPIFVWLILSRCTGPIQAPLRLGQPICRDVRADNHGSDADLDCTVSVKRSKHWRPAYARCSVEAKRSPLKSAMRSVW